VIGARPVWGAGDPKSRSAPTLETERLILRHYRKEDFRPHHAILSDREVMRHFSGPTISAEDCWRRMAAGVGSWSLLGFGGWAVTSRSDERLIGTVGLFNAWRALEPEIGEQPEMGWIFSTEVHGRGIAGEACRAVLDWADANLEPTPIWAIIAPSNEPSFRLAERLGFERVGETLYDDEPTAVLKRPARP
jgi:RimJ/RimL family protein N-acetyltransferase